MLRYFLLGTHYRSPLEFSDQSLLEAKNALDGFYDLFQRLSEFEQRTTYDDELVSTVDRARMAYSQPLDDDFNTPMALAVIQNLRGNMNRLLERGVSTERRQLARAAFREFGNVLGLFQLDKWQFNRKTLKGFEEVPVRGVEQAKVKEILSETDVEIKLMERNEARKQKDFKKADEIRQFLASRGVIIEDKPDGTSRWKR
jgi:cysteinyl-tRNA synthetase